MPTRDVAAVGLAPGLYPTPTEQGLLDKPKKTPVVNGARPSVKNRTLNRFPPACLGARKTARVQAWRMDLI